MENNTVKCPDCGSIISIAAGKKECFCTECGSKLFLHQETVARSEKTMDMNSIHELREQSYTDAETDRYTKEHNKWKIIAGAMAAASFLLSLGTWITAAKGETSMLCLFMGAVLLIGGPFAIGLTEPVSGDKKPSRGQAVLKWFCIFFLLGVIAWAAGMFIYGMNRYSG